MVTGSTAWRGSKRARGSTGAWKRKMLGGVLERSKEKKVRSSCGNLGARLVWFEFYINEHSSLKRKGVERRS